jgi:membrane protease subunit HflC
MSIIRIIGVIVAIIITISYNAFFVVDERQKALVLQFGQIKAVKENPGLAFKIPLIQEVVRYDDRILSLDTQPLEVTPLDDRRLVVDAFMRYRITDVVQFRQAVGTGGTLSAEKRLERILNAALREVLGSVGSNEILSEGRVSLMEQIRDDAIAEAVSLGIEIVDVRIKRADLPTQNLAATFQRMQAERQRMATD